VFSQVGQAGARALYHWVFEADAQYGEINGTTGGLQLSYWVDYWLARAFASPPGANRLAVTNSDPQDVDVLAVRNDDGSVEVMVVNHGVASAQDNNGHGAAADVTLDLSALHAFQTATLLTIDARTDPTTGPVATAVTPQATLRVTLPGYGVAFVTLRWDGRWCTGDALRWVAA